MALFLTQGVGLWIFGPLDNQAMTKYSNFLIEVK